MIIAILIPAFDEEFTIRKLIKKINEEYTSEKYVIVIDDGSTDKTSEISHNAGADFVITNKKNMGKAKSIIVGINKSLELGADIIVAMDADLQHDPTEIHKLVNPIKEGKADFTIGNRFNSPNDLSSMTLSHRLGNYFFTKIVNFLTGLKFRDTQCGFRGYSRDAALHLNITATGKTTPMQEEIIDLVHKNMVVKEVDLSKVPGVRDHGKSRMVKNPFVYGIRAFTMIFRTIKNHYPLRFFGFFSFMALLFSLITGIVIIMTDSGTRPEFFDWVGLEYTLVSLIFGMSLLAIGILADISSSIKLVADENLYYSKIRYFESINEK